MTDYLMVPGQRQELPPYLAGNELRLLMHRPDTPLAAVLPRVKKKVRQVGLDGRLAAMLEFTPTDWSVMPQVGYHFPLSEHAISTPDKPSRLLPYRLGEAVVLTPNRPIAPALYGFWAQSKLPGLQVFEIFRVYPAFLVGRVPDSVSGDDWLMTDLGNWRLTPGAYVIRDLNGYGGRVTDVTYLVREFDAVTELDPGDPVERFELPNFG